MPTSNHDADAPTPDDNSKVREAAGEIAQDTELQRNIVPLTNIVLASTAHSAGNPSLHVSMSKGKFKIDAPSSDEIAAKVEMHKNALASALQLRVELEKTKRYTLIAGALSFVVGLVVLALMPAPHGVSVNTAAVSLLVWPLVMTGIQDFRIRAAGIQMEAGAASIGGGKPKVKAKRQR